MGRCLTEYYLNNKDFIELVAGVDRKKEVLDIPIYSNLFECIQNHHIDVLVDFSSYPVSYEFVMFALENKINVISGTTGYQEEDFMHIEKLANINKTGVIITPNFSTGATLLAKFLKETMNYFNKLEILEAHSVSKKDIPSGTAKYLKKIAGFDVPIHSIRLPGIIAEHTMEFSDGKQILVLTHKTLNRESFISGIDYAIKEVYNTKCIKVGIQEKNSEV